MPKKRYSKTKSKLEPVAEYRDRPLRWRDLFLLFIPSAIVPLLLLMMGYRRELYGLVNYGPAAAEAWSSTWYRLAFLSLIPVLWLALIRIQRSHRVIKVYDKGIIIQSTWGRKWKFHWSQIEGVSEVKTKVRFFGIPFRTKYQAQLHPYNGKPINLDRQIKGLEELSARIKAKIFPGLLKRYRAAFRGDDTITFGPIRMNSYQIALKGKNIPWDQVSDIETKNGYLILKFNENSRIRFPIHKIPNVEVMLQVLQESVIYG